MGNGNQATVALGTKLHNIVQEWSGGYGVDVPNGMCLRSASRATCCAPTELQLFDECSALARMPPTDSSALNYLIPPLGTSLCTCCERRERRNVVCLKRARCETGCPHRRRARTACGRIRIATPVFRCRKPQSIAVASAAGQHRALHAAESQNVPHEATSMRLR